jgi:hypothetical protein
MRLALQQQQQQQQWLHTSSAQQMLQAGLNNPMELFDRCAAFCIVGPCL